MLDEPTIPQLVLVIVAAVFFAASAATSALRRSAAAAGLSGAGLAVAVVAQVLHSMHRGDWVPFQDNFDALLWLAVIIAVLSLYLQDRSSIRRIDWIANPIVALLLVGAAAFGRARPHVYTDTLWASTHRVSLFISAIAFAFAACAGSLYLALRSKLRRKAAGPVDPKFGSLETLERLNYTAVIIGFALLTIGMLSGLSRATALGDRWYLQPKVVLSFITYAVYAVVLHSPLNPTFRGKKTAILSIVGFVLLLATVAVVQK